LDLVPKKKSDRSPVLQDDHFNVKKRCCRSIQNLKISIVAMRDVIQADALAVKPEADREVVKILAWCSYFPGTYGSWVTLVSKAFSKKPLLTLVNSASTPTSQLNMAVAGIGLA
jgi:hypothetical protein